MLLIFMCVLKYRDSGNPALEQTAVFHCVSTNAFSEPSLEV